MRYYKLLLYLLCIIILMTGCSDGTQINTSEFVDLEEETVRYIGYGFKEATTFQLPNNSVTSSNYEVLAVNNDNQLVAIYYKEYTKKGNDTYQEILRYDTPKVLMEDVIAVSSYGFSSETINVLKSNGDLYAFDSQSYGLVGDIPEREQKTYSPIKIASDVEYIYQNRYRTKNGDLKVQRFDNRTNLMGVKYYEPVLFGLDDTGFSDTKAFISPKSELKAYYNDGTGFDYHIIETPVYSAYFDAPNNLYYIDKEYNLMLYDLESNVVAKPNRDSSRGVLYKIDKGVSEVALYGGNYMLVIDLNGNLYRYKIGHNYKTGQPQVSEKLRLTGNVNSVYIGKGTVSGVFLTNDGELYRIKLAMGNDTCSFYKIANNIKIIDESVSSTKTIDYEKYIGSYSILGSQKLTIHSASKDSICISMSDYGIENRTLKLVNNMAKTECELFDLLIELKEDRVVVGCSRERGYLNKGGEMWSNIYMLKLG